MKVSKNNWPLIIGLFLVFIGYSGILLFDIKSSQSNFNYPLPTFLIVVAMLAVAPIIEELFFRFILTKKGVILKIWPLVVSVFILLFSSSIVFFGILIFLSAINLLIHAKSVKNVGLSMVIFTSIAFGFAHFTIDNFNFFGFLILSGAGFICAFLRIKFSIFISILGHSSWNLFMIILLIFMSKKEIKNQNMELVRNSIFSTSDYSSSFRTSNDTIFVENGKLREIANYLINKTEIGNSELVFSNDVLKYSGYSTKSNFSLQKLADNFEMKIDSTIEMAFGFELKIEGKISDEILSREVNYTPGSSKMYRNALSKIISQFAKEAGVPIELEFSENYKDEIVTIQIPNSVSDFESFISFVQKELEINISYTKKSIPFATYYFL